MKPEPIPSSLSQSLLRKWRQLHACRSTSSRSGMAIVLSLFGISIISMVIVTFFVRTGLNRQIIFASRLDLQSELLSRVASEVVIGQLREEIRSGSTRLGKNGTPQDSTPPFTYLPLRTNDQNPKISGLRSSTIRGSLLKVSSESPTYPGSRLSASSLPTDEKKSTDGKLSEKFWYERTALGQTNQIPRWILMTRNGVTNTWKPEEPNNAPIGRFAYTIYDEGALLDATVAGAYPSYQKSYPEEMSAKSGTPFADLNVIPGMTSASIESLLQWRTPMAISSFNAYTNYIRTVGPTNGFLDCQNGNNTFLSRSELIEFATEHHFSDALPYFTHFSREKAAPSWYPTFNGTAHADFEHRDLFRFEYAKEMDSPWTKNLVSYNRNLSNVRDSNGKPLLSKRFPLSRIKLLENAPSQVNQNHDIYKYFGLTRSDENSPWVYDHGYRSSNGNTLIYELNNPAFLALKRDPDFFELLQAGILSGSTGLTSSSSDRYVYCDTSFLSVKMDCILRPYHIFKMGLNIIDQYDTDSYPTELKILGWSYVEPLTVSAPNRNATGSDAQSVTLTGQEAIPVISEIYQVAYRPQPGFGTPAQNATRDYVHIWYELEAWNPYLNATNPATIANSPAQFRAQITSGKLHIWGRQTNGPSIGPSVPVYKGAAVYDIGTPKPYVSFAPSLTFNAPTHLKPPNVLTGSPADYYMNNATDGRTLVGLYAGNYLIPDARLGAAGAGTNFMFTHSPTNNAIFISYQYLRRGGNPSQSNSWVPYQTFPGQGLAVNSPNRSFAPLTLSGNSLQPIPSYASGVNGTNQGLFTNLICTKYPVSNNLNAPFLGNQNAFSRSDPRTSRTGTSLNRAYPSIGDYYRMNMPIAWNASQLQASTPAGYTFSPYLNESYVSISGTIPYLADYADNRSSGTFPHPLFTTATYYKDLDGILRRGDGNSLIGVYPNDFQRPSDRQQILNRPFKSVAEMGYAYRDLPWKSLDFFSKNSADAALLDLFCLEEEPEIVAGRVNLNTPHAAIVQSLLQGVAFDSENKSLLLNNNPITPATIAANYVKDSSTRLNRSEIATRLENYYPETTDINAAIKNRREAIPRALSEAMQSRTWNLMIDLVVQAGQMPPGAQTLENFKVRGQKRYWVHLAIDRFTAEVIDQQIEPLAE